MSVTDGGRARRTGGRPSTAIGLIGATFPLVLERAAGGDRTAFAELWRSAHPGLLRYLAVVCGRDAAEDVASETWLKVIGNLGTFTGDENAFRGWLATIARNTAIDRGRRVSRHKEQPDGLTPAEGVVASVDPADLALQTLSTRAALELVATLPPAVAEMIVLRVILGLDVAQVAALVGRKPGTVRVAVHRGLKSLAATLARSSEPVPAGRL